MVSDENLFVLVFAVIIVVFAWWRFWVGLLAAVSVGYFVGWSVFLLLLMLIGIPLFFEILNRRQKVK